MGRSSTVLAFGAAFLLVTLVLFEAGRRVPSFALPVVGPVAGLAIQAVGSLISGALFFSSPTMWLGVRAHGTPGASARSWLMIVEVVGPFFVYGAIHGMFVGAGLSWRNMVRAFAWRYLVTFLAVAVIGLSVAMVALSFDS